MISVIFPSLQSIYKNIYFEKKKKNNLQANVFAKIVIVIQFVTLFWSSNTQKQQSLFRLVQKY